MKAEVQRAMSHVFSHGLSSFLFAMWCVLALGCSENVGEPNGGHEGGSIPPDGFPAMFEPSDNPVTDAKTELGRYLFYDERLSKDFSTACASCHQQERAFSDADQFSDGFLGRRGKRNASTLTNVGYATSLLWEGGVPTLEQQAVVPFVDTNEFALNTDSLVVRLQGVPTYQQLFRNAWGDETITIERITKAIATFERKLVSANSAFDRWNRGDESALSPEAKRGLELFFNETGDCFHCHGGYNFTDNDFHNNGLTPTEDEGRFALTQRELDRGKFKTPTLRNVEVTGPYMHDGRFSTLEEVLDHYNDGGGGHPNSDPLMRPLGLTEQEKTDIIAFLKSLTDYDFLNDPAFEDPWK